MNKKLLEALEHCKEAGYKRVVIAVPFQLTLADATNLRENPICAGMVMLNPPPEITAHSSDQWLGCFTRTGEWHLPAAKGTLVFIGSQLMLTRKMATQVLRTRRMSIICKINGSYQPLKLYRFFLWRLGEKLHRNVSQLPHENGLRKALYRIAGTYPIKQIWEVFFRRENVAINHPRAGSGFTGESLYLEVFRKALAQAEENKIKPIPGRVVLVNAGLAAGGAERQIVNTLIGLRDSDQCESVALLAEYIDRAPNLDFFLHEVVNEGIEVSQMRQTITLAADGLSSLPPSIAELAADLPSGIIEEILNLLEEFRIRRPSVVHAWQDMTSIKAGIAAVIAGVPHIVLASRNVTPVNFIYCQDYMLPAYKALATLDSVKFINNSEAGVVDYTQWLGLPKTRFNLIRNGVDLTGLQRSSTDEINSYRKSLNIPQSARVVGSVFRFYVEKRPMLWLEVAVQIARHFADVHFLIIGEGPLRPQMEKLISDNGLSERIHLPGTRPDVAPAMSAMDIFLLTSEFEGTPNVVLEAQWLGLPIVATESGGTRESFMNGGTGLLATTSEPEEIARLAGMLLCDQALMTSCAKNGRGFVEKEFGVARMIQQTLDVYCLNDSSVLSSDFKRSGHVAAT